MLIFLELALQAVSFVYPKVFTLPGSIPHKVEDERLGHRPNPEFPGHDQKGFRNRFVPDTVSIVAMGDSQTYGTWVLPGQAWPRQLESQTGFRTYSMAFGGYGPAHSLIMLEEALALKPKLIIEAFYSGNDLFNSYKLVYNKGKLPYLKSVDKNVLKAIENQQGVRPLIEKIAEITEYAREPEKKNAKIIPTQSKLLTALRVVKENIRMLFIPGHLRQPEWDVIKKRADATEYHFVFEHGDIKTVFTPDYRLCALDMEDPRISEGLRISLDAILMMKKRAEKEGIGFMILLIPTKELVFKDITFENFKAPEVYEDLVKNEEMMWEKTKEFFREHDMDFIDALPPLRESLRTNKQPYFMGFDGHPNDKGHRAIAELVKYEIGSRGLFNQDNN